MLPIFYLLVSISLLCSNSIIQCMRPSPLRQCTSSLNSGVISPASDTPVQLSEAVMDDILSDARSAHAFLAAMADRAASTTPTTSDSESSSEYDTDTDSDRSDFSYYTSTSDEELNKESEAIACETQRLVQAHLAANPDLTRTSAIVPHANFNFRFSSDDEQIAEQVNLQLIIHRYSARQVAAIGSMHFGQGPRIIVIPLSRPLGVSSSMPSLELIDPNRFLNAQVISNPSQSHHTCKFDVGRFQSEPRKESIPTFAQPKAHAKVAYKHQPKQPVARQKSRSQRIPVIRNIRMRIKDN